MLAFVSSPRTNLKRVQLPCCVQHLTLTQHNNCRSRNTSSGSRSRSSRRTGSRGHHVQVLAGADEAGVPIIVISDCWCRTSGPMNTKQIRSEYKKSSHHREMHLLSQ